MQCGRVFGCVVVFCGLWSASVGRAQTEGMDVLKGTVGQWKADIKMWAEGPDRPPMTSTGTETNEMLGENWLVSKFESEFGGQPFSGMGILGYDLEKKKYVNHWIDTMAPVMSHFEGSFDAATKTMTMTGKEQGAEAKNTTVMKDSKTRIFTMYQKPEGASDFLKLMEITYTKQ